MDKIHSWQHDIDFQCRFGIWPFKKTLEISSNGFVWCGELFPLKMIKRLRWGVDLKRGGIFPKRLYIATFGTDDKEFTIKTKQKDFYEHLTDKYWKAVGRRLLAEMLDGLKAGNKYKFGDCIIEDCGITVDNKPLFGVSEQRFYTWQELKWGIVNGSFCFASLEEPDKLLTGCSFLWVDNAHVLNVAMALLQKNENKKKLSSCA